MNCIKANDPSFKVVENDYMYELAKVSSFITLSVLEVSRVAEHSNFFAQVTTLLKEMDRVRRYSY